MPKWIKNPNEKGKIFQTIIALILNGLFYLRLNTIYNITLLNISYWVCWILFISLTFKLLYHVRRLTCDTASCEEERGVFSILFLALQFCTIFCMMIFAYTTVHSTPHETEKYDENKIYIVYSPTCAYCNQAKDEIEYATNMAKLNKVNAVYVDMSQKNELTEIMSTKTDKVGRIIKGDTVIPYVAEENNLPADPNVEQLYQTLIHLKGN